MGNEHRLDRTKNLVLGKLISPHYGIIEPPCGQYCLPILSFAWIHSNSIADENSGRTTCILSDTDHSTVLCGIPPLRGQ